MADTPRVIEPPFYDPPISNYDSGPKHSQAWTEYHQSVSDRLGEMATAAGVTDGSEAAAGDVGEYMATTGSAVGMITNAATNLASVALTPGDWDISGSVLFTAGAGTHSYFGVGITSIEIFNFATFPTVAINQGMATPAHRLNITTTVTVWVVGQAGFTGTMTGTGTIRARRMR